MRGSSPSIHARALFGLLCLGAMGVAVMAIAYHQRRGLPVPEWPLAADLFVTIPLAYLVLLRPSFKKALLGVTAIFTLGVLFGSIVLPPESKLIWPWLEQLRWVALAALLGWQACVLAQVARGLARTPAHENLELGLHASLERRFGAGAMTELLKLEARMWLYAFCRPTERLRFSGAELHFAHRQGGNASNQLGFLVLLAVELPVAHVLLHLLFGPLVAVVVSATTVYALLFLFAEYRATRLRPIAVTADTVHLRYGLFVEARLPKEAIVEVRAVAHRPRRAPRRMRLTGMGRANVLLRLAEGTRLATPFGVKEVAELFIGLDDPARFMRSVRCAEPRPPAADGT